MEHEKIELIFFNISAKPIIPKMESFQTTLILQMTHFRIHNQIISDRQTRSDESNLNDTVYAT